MLVDFWNCAPFFWIFNFYTWIYLFWLQFWMYIYLYFLISSHQRQNFFFFVIILFNFVIWGFYYNYDGIMLVVLLTELILIFTFYLIYTQTYIHVLNRTTSIRNFSSQFLILYVILSVLNFYFFEGSPQITFISANYYVSVNNITSNDFFTFFYFFFISYPLILISIIMLLGFFSIFFIFLFFFFKQFSVASKTRKKNYTFLRKQSLVHQANFKVFLRLFQ